MCVVVFDPTAFKTQYPEFSTISNGVLNGYFGLATIYLDNSDNSPVCDCTTRAVLLNLLVAHITALYAGVNGQAPSGLVGRVSQATEGSVSVTADMGATTNSQAWYMQTQYGASYWAATAQFRTARYLPGRSFPNVARRGIW